MVGVTCGGVWYLAAEWKWVVGQVHSSMDCLEALRLLLLPLQPSALCVCVCASGVAFGLAFV